MPSSSFSGRHWGMLWALALILFALALSPNGGWTIDDGVKRIGAQNSEAPWYVTLSDGSLRAALQNSSAYAPLSPPFALRQEGGYRIGFAPFAMVLWGTLAGLGWWAIALLPVLGSLFVWLLLRRWNVAAEEVVFLLPLTFYGLVLWEHSIVLAMEAGALVLLFRRSSRLSIVSLTLSAVLLAAGTLFRPETLWLVPVICFWLWWREGARPAMLVLVMSAVLIVAGLMLSRPPGGSLIPTQILANFRASGANSYGEALIERAEAFWIFALAMDKNVWVSLGLLLMLCGGSFLIYLGEQRQAIRFLVIGGAALLLWFFVGQVRLWTHHLPPVALLSRNSLFTAFPWLLLFFFYGAKEGKSFIGMGFAVAFLIFLTTPVFRGVHWGPRLLLPAMPLFFIAYTQGKAHFKQPGWLWRSLVILTILQTLSGAALVYGRRVETAERVQFLSGKVRTPFVVLSQSQVADLASLWGSAEMFTAQSPAELRRFVADARRANVKTFWLLLPQSEEAEFAKRLSDLPMRLIEGSEIETGVFWKTLWWLGEYEDAGDSLSWAAFYDELARREIGKGNLQRALPEHKSATLFAPARADYHYNYAVTLGKLGHFTEAEAELRRALKADSLHEAARELLRKLP